MSDTADDFKTAFNEWKTQLEKLGLAELTGDDSPYEGPLVDMAGVDQAKYNNDLSECRHKK